MNNLLQHIELDQNKTATTKNGAISNTSSLNYCVDLFGKIAALRSQPTAKILSLFSKAFGEDPTTALKILFYARDIRGGQGERNTFRVILRDLAVHESEWVTNNLHLIPLFGRFDDLYCLVDTPCGNAAFAFMHKQFKQDLVHSNQPSLLAKWLKRENTSSVESRRLGSLTRKYFGLSSRQYRKAIVSLCNKLDVVEQKMSSNRWKAITYSAVPSNASLLYRNAFTKHDADRYAAYISNVEKGVEKINTSTLYPVDLVSKYLGTSFGVDRTVEVQWKNLPNYVKPFNGIVVADVSGSMSGIPIQVSISLALYIAERNTGPFHNKFISFSETPKLQSVTGTTLRDKVMNLSSSEWGFSTNLISVFNLILNTALENDLEQSDLPKTIFIVSDMQFDQACKNNNKTNFEVIRKKYKKAKYKMPNLVFWNVNAIESDTPITVHDTGTALVSGYSPVVLKAVLESKVITPQDVMNTAILSERYSVVSYAK